MAVVTPVHMLDTNMVSSLVARHSERVQLQYAEREKVSRITISAVTEGEIRYGLSKRPDATKLHHYMQRFLQRIEVLPWDSKVTQSYGVLRAKVEALGLSPGPLDLMIAAHAVAENATLVTHDRALKRLSSFIMIEDWLGDLNES